MHSATLDSRTFVNASPQELAMAGFKAIALHLIAKRLPSIIAIKNNQWVAREQRYSLKLPVDLNGTAATTRDVSRSGIFFETNATYRFSRTIDIGVELETPRGALLFLCRGNVVRIEPHDYKVGVAAHILKSSVEPAWW